ncbi:hypothetical protein Tcan_05533 [Toxocara canis]|uniref:Uncharacterized protein n=1 Tax=Toxocara canis TaxID=6265 RepID=A0A0B2VTQ4_TOXCA|nr:hypothetical protein Tcan_05533 [Toxocara canis]
MVVELVDGAPKTPIAFPDPSQRTLHTCVSRSDTVVMSSTQMESTDPPSPNPNVQVAIVSPTSASEKCNSHSFTEESKEEEETHSEEVKETVERDLVAILPERLSAPTSDSPAAGDSGHVTVGADESRKQDASALQSISEHKCEDMVTKAKQRFRRMVNVLKWTAKIFYIACPPVPKVVIRKAVFHPPKRYHYYYLIGEECGKRKRIRSAKEAKHSRDVVFFIPQLLLPSFENSDVFDQLERIKVQSREFPANIALLSLYIKCAQSYRLRISFPYVILFAQPNSSDLGSCMITDPNLVCLRNNA